MQEKIEIRQPSRMPGAGIITTWLGEGLRQALLFPALRLFVQVQVNGTELLNWEGPYIFAANHASHLDTPLLLAALPFRLRLRTRVAAAADYFFTTPWKAVLVRIILNAFAFERKGRGFIESLAQAQQFLDAGYSLLVFPEGTRSKDGRLQPFKRGIGKLALAGSAQVVPIWIEGTYASLPKGARWPCRQKVTIHFGVPLCFISSNNLSGVVAEIKQQVRALAP